MGVEGVPLLVVVAVVAVVGVAAWPSSMDATGDISPRSATPQHAMHRSYPAMTMHTRAHTIGCCEAECLANEPTHELKTEEGETSARRETKLQ